jgi:hypothetical protein
MIAAEQHPREERSASQKRADVGNVKPFRGM